MANSPLLFLLTVLFSTVQCAHLPLGNSIIERISNTKFCASILSPDESALKRSLQAAFINNVKKDAKFDEKDHLDLCCRSFYKCDSYKSIEFNYKTEWNTRHCDCEYFFDTCLKNLNTTLSNALRIIHTVNTPKCYANDYPIINCIDREKPSNRCTKYELDESKAKIMQLFDLSYHQTSRTAISGKNFGATFFLFMLLLKRE